MKLRKLKHDECARVSGTAFYFVYTYTNTDKNVQILYNLQLL